MEVRNIPLVALCCPFPASPLTIVKGKSPTGAGTIQAAPGNEWIEGGSIPETAKWKLSPELFHLDVACLTPLSIQFGIVGTSLIGNVWAETWGERERRGENRGGRGREGRGEDWCFGQREEWVQKPWGGTAFCWEV